MSLSGLLSFDITLKGRPELGDHSIDVTLKGTDVTLGSDVGHFTEVACGGCIGLSK
jgi:hypothetical protein